MKEKQFQIIKNYESVIFGNYFYGYLKRCGYNFPFKLLKTQIHFYFNFYLFTLKFSYLELNFYISKVQMQVCNWLHKLFYSLELVHQHRQYPRMYWFIYAINILHFFANIETQLGSIWFSSVTKIASLQSVLSEPVVFGYLISMIGLQLTGFIILAYLGKNGNIRKSNFSDILMTLLFWVCFLNFTVNLTICDGFRDPAFKTACVAVYSLVYFANLVLINCTLNSKRVWIVNQMLMVDLLRALLLWTNGNRVLVFICLVMCLVTSLGILFVRPVFHLSIQNRLAQMLTSLSFTLAIVSTVKLSTSSNQSFTLLELTFLVILTYLLFLLLQKWLSYKISKLYNKSFSVQKTEATLNDSTYDITDFVLLQFLHENFNNCQDKIQLFMLDHVTKCKQSHHCNCQDVVNTFLGKKAKQAQERQNQQSQQKNPYQQTQQKLGQFMVQPTETLKKTDEFQEAFSKFLLVNLGKYLSESAEMSMAQMLLVISLEKAKEVKKQAPFRKQTSQLERSDFLKNSMILQYIRLEALLNSSVNLNSAYTTLKSLEFQLRSNKVLSSQESGILAYLNQQIVSRKLISMQVPNEHTNMFCVKYFDNQKVTNDLWETVVKTVEEIKVFWTEIRLEQPDEKKALSVMSRIYKQHNRIINFYEEISQSEEKPSQEMVMIFKLYQQILELESEYRFFGTNQLKLKEEQNIKKIGSINKKLYLSGTETRTVSFSIDQENFGDIKYMSTGARQFLDPKIKNLKDLVPLQLQDHHCRSIKRYLEKDHSYYQHTITQPCYIKVDQSIIKPVFLETHLLSIISNGRIELVAFFKPLVEDFTLLRKDVRKSFGSHSEEDVTIFIDSDRKILAWTEGFNTTKNSAFTQHDIDDLLTQANLDQLKKYQPLSLELADENYELSLVKSIQSSYTNYLYIIQFTNINTKNQGQNRQNFDINPSQNDRQSGLNKNSPLEISNNSIVKKIQTQLDEVEKFDQVKNKINKIWQIVSTTEKNSFGKKWLFFAMILVFVFFGFIVATTVLMYSGNSQFKNFNNFLTDFSQNQVATVQAITYLRQININLFTEQTNKIQMIPKIVDEIDRLDKIIFDKTMKLSPQLADIVWSSTEILPNGQKIIRKQKAFAVFNNYVTNPITNLVNNLRESMNALNFTVVKAQIKSPYTVSQENFIKIVTNAVNYIIPSLIALRQSIIDKKFLIIKDVISKPRFQIPIAGIGVCIIWICFIFFRNRKLTQLTKSTFQIFTKLQIQFSVRKLQQIQKRHQIIYNHQPFISKLPLKSKNIAQKQQGRLQDQNTFDGSVKNNDKEIISAEKVNQMQNLSNLDNQKLQQNQIQFSESNRYTIHQETDRQLNKQMDMETKTQSQDDNQFSDSRAKKKTKKMNEEIFNQTQRLKFCGQSIMNQTFLSKMFSVWIIIPIILYFSHIILISVKFNEFMESILMLQNKILYRQGSITNFWNFQYELGLFEDSTSLADSIINGIDTRYQKERELDFYETETQKYLFGKLKNYNMAVQIFSMGNVCESLDLLKFHQPSFSTNLSKAECETLASGVLMRGTKQATVFMMQEFRAMVLENKSPQIYSPTKRLQYLQDQRIQTYNKIYSFIMAANQYTTREFDKDFDQLLKFYVILMIIDGPLMMVIGIGMMSVYFVKFYRKIKKQIAIISCCFLVIGHGTFLRDPTLLEDTQTQNPAERYFLLQ